MAALVSIRMDDVLFQAMRSKAQILHISQTDYIRKAIERMNDMLTRQEQVQKLQQASMKVRNENMKINAEFSDIEYDPED